MNEGKMEQNELSQIICLHNEIFKLNCINIRYKVCTLGSVFAYSVYVQIFVYNFNIPYTFPIFQTARASQCYVPSPCGVFQQLSEGSSSVRAAASCCNTWKGARANQM